MIFDRRRGPNLIDEVTRLGVETKYAVKISEEAREDMRVLSSRVDPGLSDEVSELRQSVALINERLSRLDLTQTERINTRFRYWESVGLVAILAVLLFVAWQSLSSP